MESRGIKISKGVLQSDELSQYILETSVYPREPAPLKELRDATASHPRAGLATAPDAAQLLAMLLRLIDAKKTIEIGVFTGYSLLLTALTIPADGKIVAIDINRETYDQIGLPIIKKAGVEHKIDFIESEAVPVLDKLLEHLIATYLLLVGGRTGDYCSLKMKAVSTLPMWMPTRLTIGITTRDY